MAWILKGLTPTVFNILHTCPSFCDYVSKILKKWHYLLSLIWQENLRWVSRWAHQRCTTLLKASVIKYPWFNMIQLPAIHAHTPCSKVLCSLPSSFGCFHCCFRILHTLRLKSLILLRKSISNLEPDDLQEWTSRWQKQFKRLLTKWVTIAGRLEGSEPDTRSW